MKMILEEYGSVIVSAILILPMIGLATFFTTELVTFLTALVERI